MKEVLEGSHAVAEAVRLARVNVVSAYPITPQTHIVEALSEYVAEGAMPARFICVESEHSAMAAVVGAASGGVRTFTASSSHGLALMHEMLHWAAGARLPIVMAAVNRAIGPGWNIWCDQSDSLSQRDTGWIQLYCEDGQEALDTTLQAFRLAEMLNLPVMVMLDAFFLSHTFEPVDIPEPADVDRFLPPFQPRICIDPQCPSDLCQLVPPAVFMEMRHSAQQAMEAVPQAFAHVEDEFAVVFDRRYGILESVGCEDADVILLLTGTAVGTGRCAVEQLRRQGESVGLLKLKMLRPFPVMAVAGALGAASKVAVVDRSCSFGIGGIFAHEIRAALCNQNVRPQVYSYIAGLGGRDITPDVITEAYYQTKTGSAPPLHSVWLGLNDAPLNNTAS